MYISNTRKELKMLEKDTKIKLEIADMSSEGNAIGKADGFTVFLDQGIIAMTGDIVMAEITKVKKKYAFGKVTEILESSPDRIEAICKDFDQCGGCSLQIMKYEKQLELKEKIVRETLARIGGVESAVVKPIIGMDNPTAYRNKAQYPVSAGGAVGFFKARTHDVVDIEDCVIQSEPANLVAKIVREYIKLGGMTAYNRETTKGLLRHVIVKTGVATKEVMVVLVVNDGKMPKINGLVEMLKEKITAPWILKSVAVNYNQKDSSLVLGKKSEIKFGIDKINDTLGELTFEISVDSFFQVNSLQTQKLYDTAVDYAKLTGKETVLDIYCGVGTIGLHMAGKAKKIIGIESVKSAVEDAQRNAEVNKIANVEFICGDVETVLPKMAADGENFDVAILDPPRAGCDAKLLEAVATTNPKRIVYVSCDPSTLARDIKILGGLGYQFQEAQPVDMFPHTMHVECVVLMER